MKKLIKTAIETLKQLRILPQIKPTPANLQAFYQIQIKSPDGKIRFDTHLRESHSFIFQFLEMIQYCFRRTTMSNITDVGGVSRSFGMSNWDITLFDVLRAAQGNSTYGIVVGSGTNAESNTDIALQTKIANGSGAGQLLYGNHSYINTKIVGANVDYEMSRTFMNDSGGSVTINEIGIYSKMYDGSYRYVCLVRDLTGGVTVTDGNSIFVRYVLRTTV